MAGKSRLMYVLVRCHWSCSGLDGFSHDLQHYGLLKRLIKSFKGTTNKIQTRTNKQIRSEQIRANRGQIKQTNGK